MDKFVLELVKSITGSEVTLEVGLLLLIVVMLLYAFNIVLPRITKNVGQKKEIEDMLYSKLKMDELVNKLNRTLEKLDYIENVASSDSKDTEILRRDIEEIKQILTQFQGGMMYGSNNKFGNQELR